MANGTVKWFNDAKGYGFITPAERVAAPVGVVIDVLRATSTICQALAAGWGRVVCVGEIDDAYVAGRIAAALAGTPGDSAIAAVRLAAAFPEAESGIAGGVSAANIRKASLDEDIPWCARESVLDLVPRVVERGARSVVVALARRG